MTELQERIVDLLGKVPATNREIAAELRVNMLDIAFQRALAGLKEAGAVTFNPATRLWSIAASALAGEAHAHENGDEPEPPTPEITEDAVLAREADDPMTAEDATEMADDGAESPAEPEERVSVSLVTADMLVPIEELSDEARRAVDNLGEVALAIVVFAWRQGADGFTVSDLLAHFGIPGEPSSTRRYSRIRTAMERLRRSQLLGKVGYGQYRYQGPDLTPVERPPPRWFKNEEPWPPSVVKAPDIRAAQERINGAMNRLLDNQALCAPGPIRLVTSAPPAPLERTRDAMIAFMEGIAERVGSLPASELTSAAKAMARAADYVIGIEIGQRDEVKHERTGQEGGNAGGPAGRDG